MAAFDTTIPLLMDTDLPLAPIKQPVTMKDGTTFIESYSTVERVDSGVIVCGELTETEKNTVVTFYTTNKDLVFTFTNPHDGLDYDLEFIGSPPDIKRAFPDSPYYIVRLFVMGVKS
jgi:hypothetical protein